LTRRAGETIVPRAVAFESLPLRAKLLYASASVGGEALSQSRGLWLLYYYAPPPEEADLPKLLPVAAVSVILFAARLVESFDDALVGFWSDRTRSRLGRRIPFVLAASPLWAVFGFLLFTPPADAGRFATGLYLFVVLELFFLSGTFASGPYEALLPELARTSRDRVTIVGMRVYLGAAGAAFGLVVSGLVIDRYGFRAMGLLMAALALGFRYLGLFGVWGYAKRTAPPAELSFRDSMRATFSNRAFLAFLPTYVCFQVGFQMLIGVLPYWVTAILRVEDEGTWVAVLTAAAIVFVVVTVPFLAFAARRASKRHVYRGSMIAAAVAFPLLFFAGFVPGVPDQAEILVVAALAGAAVAGNYLFPAALTADIVDDDAGRTGQRREATFYGAQNFVEKTATSVAPLLLGLLLLLGRSSDDPLGIRLVGPVAGLAVLAGYLSFRRYELPDELPLEAIAAPSVPTRS
jgi:glycoside/pentoside/hexuronide:cation symporter, GPH family